MNFSVSLPCSGQIFSRGMDTSTTSRTSGKGIYFPIIDLTVFFWEKTLN